jgi:hypothetical protein
MGNMSNMDQTQKDPNNMGTMGMGRQGQAPAGTWTPSSTMGNMGTMGNDNMPHSNMGYGNMTH